ncbi:MAG: chromosome segregation protein SMC, partial [Alphaproteobacteria bacterium]
TTVREAFTQTQADHIASREQEESSRAAFREADSALTRMTAERDALQALVARDTSGGGTPVLDSLQVAEGYETALGVALGEDLDAPLGDDGAAGWTLLPPLGDAPALPGGTEPLSNHVTAPSELARRLSQIGVVSDEQGPALARDLRPGQRLVST